MDDVGRKTFLTATALCTAALLLGAPLAHAKKANGEGKSKPRAAKREPVAEAPVNAGILPNGELALAAQGATVIDALTGDPLYEKNAYERFYPASSTKILTALLVIEEGDLDRMVVIVPEDTKVEPSSIGFKPGDQFTRRELLYALLLKSANDVAQALGRDNAGSIKAFSEKMNRRAASLGATQSHFANPHGLHNAEHYTTPHDLALIARAAMQQPFFRQLVSTISYPWVTGQGITQLQNHNKMLWCPPWKFAGCTGLKTGYTVPAQGVLVSSALRNHREVISVVMHTGKEEKWKDSRALLTYGFSHLPEAPRFN